MYRYGSLEGMWPVALVHVASEEVWHGLIAIEVQMSAFLASVVRDMVDSSPAISKLWRHLHCINLYVATLSLSVSLSLCKQSQRIKNLFTDMKMSMARDKSNFYKRLWHNITGKTPVKYKYDALNEVCIFLKNWTCFYVRFRTL